MTSDYRELKEREEELVRRREMSKSPTTTTTTSVHPRNPSPSLASTTRPSSPVKSTPTIKSSPPSPSHAPPHHHVVQEKPKSRYKKTNKQECKRKRKVLFKNSTSWFPARSSTRPTTGHFFLQVDQDLASWKTSSPTAAGTYYLPTQMQG